MSCRGERGLTSRTLAVAAAVLLCVWTCSDPARGAATSASDWSADDTDGDGSFMLSPDAAADFVVPAGFQVLDLTRESQRIPGQPARYLVLASRVVRPSQPFRLSVNVLLAPVPVTVRAALYRDSVRLSQVRRDCTPQKMELLQIPVPNNTGPGRYELYTEANEIDQLEGTLFRNRTLLRFEARSLTMLVQMDSPVYRQLQTVRFRVVLLGTDLMSFKSSADIALLDPKGVIMKRWMSRQSNTGLVSAEYQLGERPAAGTWVVRVSARGQTEEQPFLVELYQPPRFEVLVETPPLLRTSDYDLHVWVSSNYTAGGGRVSGRLTLLAEAAPIRRRPGYRAKQAVLETLSTFSGRHQFLLDLKRLRKLLQPLDGSEVKVTAQLVDSVLQVTGQGHSITRVYGDTIQLRFLGGVSQRFRPHMPFRTHLVGYMTDGSRLAADRLIEHRLDVLPELVFKDGKKFALPKRRAQMSNNHPGVWVVEVNLAEEKDFSALVDRVRYLRLSASLKDYYGKSARAQAVATAQHTPYNLHLHLATSTHFPKVGEFLILHVRCNFYIERLRYVVLSKGILLDHGEIQVEVPLHTFPLAVTPEMAPEATIMIFHLTGYGQIVSDTLRFPVSGLARNNLTVTVARTNHPRRPRHEVEVAVKGRSGATIGLAAFQSDLYHSTAGTDVSSYKLLRAMQKFDTDGARREFTHQWSTEDGRPGPAVHLASHLTALGPNFARESSELLVLTDATLPSTLAPPGCSGGGLACAAGGCYSTAARCDGRVDCDDMSDEGGCDRDVLVPNGDDFLLRRRNRVLADFRPSWLWSDVTVGSNGHVILQAAGPNVTSSWTVSGIGVGEKAGLGYVHTDAQYWVRRKLEASAALPAACVLGEQVSLVVTLVNRDHRLAKVNLVLGKSTQYRFVNLQELGKQRPDQWSDSLVEHRTSVTLRPGVARTVTLPVQPRSPGRVTVHLYTEQLAEKHALSRSTHVRLPGVPVLRHTALLAEVTSRPYLYTFLDVADSAEAVPGSFRATVSLTGGVAGPWPQPGADVSPPTADAALCQLQRTLQQLQYLQPAPRRAARLRDSLSSSYQSLLAFRRSDGSFAIYGGDQPSSVWMTAHAVRALATLHMAPRHQRALLDIEVLVSAARWLVIEQQQSGAFRETTLAADQRFNDTSDVILTSHVLLALTEVLRAADRGDDSEEDGDGDSELLDVSGVKMALSAAAAFLEQRSRHQLEPLQTSMVALALVSRGGRTAEHALRLLARHVRDEKEFMYWSRRAHPLPAYRVVGNVPYLQPRRPLDHESETVLATALALRVHVTLSQPRAAAIANWLTAHRCTDTGWLAEMDTVVVTEALLEFWRARETRPPLSVQMDVEAGGERNSLHTHTGTAGLRQRLEVARPEGGLKLRLTGSGMAVAQLTVQYRVPFLLEKGPFRLDVDAAHHNANGSHLTIGVCVRWTDQEEPVSGAAVLRLDVPSGYGVSPAVLEQYVHSGLVPGLVSAQLVSPLHQLVLVYQSLTERPACARLTVVRWFAVTNISKSLSATVYQLHQPERRSATMFDVSALSQYGLCDLCGSYQCSSCSVSDRTSAGAPLLPPPLLLSLLLLQVLLLPQLLTCR